MQDPSSLAAKVSAQTNASRQSKFNFKISHKIALCFCLLLILVFSSFWLVSKFELNKTLQQQTDELGMTLSIQTAASVRELVLSNDLLSLNVVLNQLVDVNTINSVRIFDIDGRLLSSAGKFTPAIAEANNILNATYIAEITLQDSIAGSVQFQLDTSSLQASIDKIQMWFWVSLGLGLLLTIVSALALASHFTTPILGIISALQDPLRNNLIPKATSNDEIALLETTCAQLLDKYNEDNTELQNLAGLGLASRNKKFTNRAAKTMASILIVKVVNINTAIELLHPSTLSQLLAEYLYYLKQAVQLYGAELHRITGETVMIVFSSLPEEDETEDHSFNAICCAQLFLQLMDKVRQEHKSNTSQALAFQLAIHSGDIFIATDNVQNSEQNNYLMGKAIETSYFLCKQSQPSELIISETTYSQAGGQNRLVSKDSREITMPTDNMSFMAYILSSEGTDYAETIQQQRQHILS